MAANTPENKVKKQIKGLLAEYDMLYSNWPVPTGFGTPTLDMIGCYYGRFFAIEAKAPGKKPTPRQRLCIEQMREAGAEVFVIDGANGEIDRLREWLDATARENSSGEPSAQGAGYTE